MRPLPSPRVGDRERRGELVDHRLEVQPDAFRVEGPPPGDADGPGGLGEPAAPLGATDGSGEADAGASEGGTGDDVAPAPPQAARTTSRTAARPAANGGRLGDGIARCYRGTCREARAGRIGLLGCAARRDHGVLDRLISGAGALTDRADRLVRALTSGRGPDVMGNRPGSVLVIAILIVASVVFGLLALESTDNPTPRAIAPAEVASADDIGRRVYATIEGVVADSFVETFADDDGDGIQDADETGDAWYYFLVDESGNGVTVRSTRHPDDIYRYTATGTVVRDPEYVSVDVAQFGQLDGTSGIELDDTFYLDASTVPSGSPQPLDLSAEMPAPGTAVTITGPYIGWLDVCSGDADGDGECEESEFDAIDAFIADPGSGRAITVVQADHPGPVPIQFTGMLRDEAASIRKAKSTRDLDFDSLGITVSDRYLLDDQAAPASAGLSLGLAILAGLLAAILAVGLVGGYLVFRRSKRPLPSGGRRWDRATRSRST